MTWLRDLGLDDYAQAFRANHIDAKVLPRLTADDLTALGITSVGHWRKLAHSGNRRRQLLEASGGNGAPARYLARAF